MYYQNTAKHTRNIWEHPGTILFSYPRIEIFLGNLGTIVRNPFVFYLEYIILSKNCEDEDREIIKSA